MVTYGNKTVRDERNFHACPIGYHQQVKAARLGKQAWWRQNNLAHTPRARIQGDCLTTLRTRESITLFTLFHL